MIDYGGDGLERFDYQRQEEERRRQEPAELRRLVRLAYSEPEQAGREAKSQGLYLDFIDRMLRVHKRLTYQYRSH